MEQQENNVAAQHAVLQMTVEITRKATGLVETYQLVGTPVPDSTPEQPKEES